MPFKEDHTEMLWEIIHNDCKILDLKACRADSADHPNPIVADILYEIGRAEIIIADLTESNENVLYELGIAHVRCDSVILVCQKDQALPFDLAHLSCIFYDINTLRNYSQVAGVDRQEALRLATITALEQSLAFLESKQADQ